MGKFVYEGGHKVEIEDRALTHLQLVMTAKLRRGEPFTFTWREDVSVGGGRTTVWIHAGSSMSFKFYGSRQPPINRAWVDALAFTANAPSGLYLVPEPAEGSTLDRDLATSTA
ncbi:ATP-dependent DNA ligase [Microbacterium foliorum]|uniref:ATP-dependent DNA ligase n=1 Tax=Microbacterium foliorum TaxID=104336 RepID=A0A4Y5YSK5_9MICO|nr:ATP-dependent DNA ligase [Microbacterium foliorum]QDE35588.1 ATP-dependent DNA ligase [Microbacterium foliorum]